MLERIKELFEKRKKVAVRSSKSKQIDLKTMNRTLKENPKAILIDVRSSQEYKEGHLNRSINIPLGELKDRIEEVTKDEKEITICLYCETGNRSERGQEILEKMGYENVWNLKGGLDEN